MTHRDLPWNELRTFREVMRDGSLSAAARRLGLTQPTVGRHIDALEASLGLALFARSPRGLAPTDAARRLVPLVEDMASASESLARVAAGEVAPDQGVVRVTASDLVGCEVLPPVLASYRAKNPGVAIELALTNRNEDLARREADIAVRMSRPTQNALVARRLGVTRIGLFAHRDYLARFGTPTTLEELAQHRLIGFDRDDRTFRAAGPFARQLRPETFGFRCDNDLAQLAALRAGVGIGGAQELVARRTPELVRVLAQTVVMSLEVWLVMHEDLSATPRIRRLYDHLAEGLLAFLAGR